MIRTLVRSRTTKLQRVLTLIELLVVISIVGILIAIMLPAISKIPESTRRVVCLSNLRQCYLAHVMYSNINKGVVAFVARSGVEWSRTTVDMGAAFPNDKVPVPDPWSIIQAYTGSKAPKVVLCPSRDPYSRNGDQRMWTPSATQYWVKGFTTYPLTAGSVPARAGGIGPTAPQVRVIRETD